MTEKTRYRLIALSKTDINLEIAKKYIGEAEIIEDGISALRWSDILLRRIRLISKVNRKELPSANDKIKALLIKALRLCIADDLAIQNANKCISACDTENIFFIEGVNISAICDFHFGDRFKVMELNKVYRVSEKVKVLTPADQTPGIAVFNNICDRTFITKYKKSHPNKTIVIRFHDRLLGSICRRKKDFDHIRSMLATLKAENIVDVIESYCRSDAGLLECSYRPNGANSSAMKSLRSSSRSWLYRFIGSTRTYNSDAMNDIRKELFKIYPEIKHWIDDGLNGSKRARIPYKQYLDITARAEVAVDTIRVMPEEGFSFRTSEALFLNRKIITDRKDIVKEPFYSSDRVFIIGVDNTDRLKTFLETDIKPLPKNILDLYDTSLWWSENDPRMDATK